MNLKKLSVAIVVSFIILMVSGFLIHGVWLANTYNQMRVSGMNFRPETDMMHKMWVIWVSNLVYAFLFVFVYARGAENKPWLGQGMRFGIIATLFTVVPNTLNDYLVYNIPYTLAVKWMISGLAVLMVMGVVVAAICKKTPASA
ncbi:MAG: DUF1761 domain-containing protein [Candidatus Acidiferrales bacterium]